MRQYHEKQSDNSRRWNAQQPGLLESKLEGKKWGVLRVTVDALTPKCKGGFHPGMLGLNKPAVVNWGNLQVNNRCYFKNSFG